MEKVISQSMSVQLKTFVTPLVSVPSIFITRHIIQLALLLSAIHFKYSQALIIAFLDKLLHCYFKSLYSVHSQLQIIHIDPN
jgi:hypothetical protein